MLKAVFFDVDGTLLDTTEYIYQAFEHSLRSNKHALVSRDVMSHAIGKSLEDCYREFTDTEVVVHLMQQHKEFQLQNLDLVRLFPHTIQTLEKLRTKGLAIAAITSRAKKSVVQSLEVSGAYPLIDYCIAIEDVAVPKPDPEGIHKALTFFSIKSEEAMMVGDSPADIEAGRNASVSTVGAAYGFHGERIRETKPDHTISDISEMVEIVSR